MAYKINERCDNCGKCLKICPVGAILAEETEPKINPELCTDCGSCADICPERAIEGQEDH
jgi:ferredoxin